MAWLILGFAILAEVVGTTALKYTEGFTKTLPTVVTFIGYGLSFFALSRILDQVPLAIAYAIWSGAGISLVGFIGWFWFDQKLDIGALVGISLIVIGVVVINLFSKSVHISLLSPETKVFAPKKLMSFMFIKDLQQFRKCHINVI